MTVFQTIAALLTAAALAGYLNQRFLHLPSTIALMGFSLVLSLSLMGLNKLDIVDLHDATAFVGTIDFSSFLLDGVLSLLLFAGAMQIDLSELRVVRLSVVTLATVGVVITTFVTGGLLWGVAAIFGFHLPLIDAFLFGALIAPTDPVAVLAVLKKVQVSKRLFACIGGESLLNDGMALVVFLAILGLATYGGHVEPSSLASEFAWSVLGGAGLGIALGLATSYLLQSINDYQSEILLTLALASGGYVLAQMVTTSGPIAITVAGFVIGSQGKMRGAAGVTRRHLFMFWDLMDEILNAVLFLVMGMVLVIIPFTAEYLAMGLMAVPILLISRLISVGMPIGVIRFLRKVEPGTIRILTWGGLRGGISIAMALSLPPMPQRELILAMTYIVVVFSILVQGLTFPSLVKLFITKEKE